MWVYVKILHDNVLRHHFDLILPKAHHPLILCVLYPGPWASNQSQLRKRRAHVKPRSELNQNEDVYCTILRLEHKIITHDYQKSNEINNHDFDMLKSYSSEWAMLTLRLILPSPPHHHQLFHHRPPTYAF